MVETSGPPLRMNYGFVHQFAMMEIGAEYLSIPHYSTIYCREFDQKDLPEGFSFETTAPYLGVRVGSLFCFKCGEGYQRYIYFGNTHSEFYDSQFTAPCPKHPRFKKNTMTWLQPFRTLMETEKDKDFAQTLVESMALFYLVAKGFITALNGDSNWKQIRWFKTACVQFHAATLPPVATKADSGRAGTIVIPKNQGSSSRKQTKNKQREQSTPAQANLVNQSVSNTPQQASPPEVPTSSLETPSAQLPNTPKLEEPVENLATGPEEPIRPAQRRAREETPDIDDVAESFLRASKKLKTNNATLEAQASETALKLVENQKKKEEAEARAIAAEQRVREVEEKARGFHLVQAEKKELERQVETLNSEIKEMREKLEKHKENLKKMSLDL